MVSRQHHHRSSCVLQDEKKEEEYIPVSQSKMAPRSSDTAKAGTKNLAKSHCNVQFSQLKIREYPIEIGDNPGSASGPSLSIGWLHFSETELSVDEYESRRPRRRFRQEMLVPPDTRFERLRSAGFSRKEILQATRPVNIVRQQRRRTRETLQLQPLYEMNEKFGRKAIQLLTMGKRKKEERDLLSRSNHGSSIDSSRSSFLDRSQNSFRIDCPELSNERVEGQPKESSEVESARKYHSPMIAYASSDDQSELSC